MRDRRLAIPLPPGYAHGALLCSPLEPQPYEHWEECISPLRLLLKWASIEGAEPTEWSRCELHRVAKEDGQWRIVSIWKPEDRKNVRQLFGHELKT